MFAFLNTTKHIFILALLAISISCSSVEKPYKAYEIEGKIKGLDKGNIKLIDYSKRYNGEIIKKGKIVDGAFLLKGKIKHTQEVYLVIDDIYETLLFLEPSKIKITLNTKAILYECSHKVLKVDVDASEANKTYQKYLYLEDSIYNLKNFKLLQNCNKPYNLENKSKIIEIQKELGYKVDSLRLKFVTNNASSLTAPYIILNEGNGFDNISYSINDMEAICNGFSNQAKQSNYYKDCLDVYNISKRLSKGEKAPDFSLNSLKNKEVSLDEFRGKHVLLLFWTPWCNKCISNISELKKLYKTYSSNNFEILGISDDPDIESLQSTVSELELKWPQLIINHHSNVADLYNIHFLPTSYLLDENGNILIANPSINELEKHLLNLVND